MKTIPITNREQYLLDKYDNAKAQNAQLLEALKEVLQDLPIGSLAEKRVKQAIKTEEK